MTTLTTTTRRGLLASVVLGLVQAAVWPFTSSHGRTVPVGKLDDLAMKPRVHANGDLG
jgi:hypothetical protein